MQTAFRILANTPIWVFVLLAYLVWQGLQALRTRTQAVWRMLIVPLVFFLMGLSRLVLAHDNAIAPLLAWLVALLLFGAPRAVQWPAAAGGRQAKGHGDPARQHRAFAAQPHGVLAAIWRGGRNRHETGTACGRGGHRSRRLGRQHRVFFRLDGRTLAPLPEF